MILLATALIQNKALCLHRISNFEPHLSDCVVLAFWTLVIDELVFFVDLLDVSGEYEFVDESHFAVGTNMLAFRRVVHHRRNLNLSVAVTSQIKLTCKQKNQTRRILGKMRKDVGVAKECLI